MYDLLKSAVNGEENRNFSFYIEGDLCQMSAQRSFLNARGIETKQNNVYPCLRQEDVAEALHMIWDSKVEGWWHYMDDYVRHSVCTKEEFLAYLNR